MPFVSIIILNYNGKNLLLRCLQSLLDFTEYPSYEILVIDNGREVQLMSRMPYETNLDCDTRN